ncbi:MAG: hypothetical protein EXS10_00260 [Phycisphaerales bacterium]|nr:hypothetical protein [Phycisphaerales bacterium]
MIYRLQPLRSTLAIGFTAAALAFGFTPSAQAQFGGRSSLASSFVPDFTPRDLVVFIDSLGLEEWQRPVLEVLLDDYSSGFNAGIEGVRGEMASLKDKVSGVDANSVMSLITGPMEKWQTEKRVLRDDFLNNLKSQLSDQQLEQWPRLERALRREKSLPMAELSGEAVNLMGVARDMQMGALQIDAIQPMLDQYELTLDVALADRDLTIENASKELMQAMSANDPQRGITAQERIMEKRIAVRAVQENATAQIKDALGADLGAQFEMKVLERAFPQVFRPDPVTPLFESALSMTDLTAEKRASIDSLFLEFVPQNFGANMTLMQAMRISEPQEPRRRTEAIQARKQGGATVRSAEAEGVAAARDAREAVWEKYRNKLYELLSDEERENLPGVGKPDQAETAGKTQTGRSSSAATSLGATDRGPAAKHGTPGLTGNNPKETTGEKASRTTGADRSSGGRGVPSGAPRQAAD